MSSLAQDESRSISENVTWENERVFLTEISPSLIRVSLGYVKGENGLPQIVEEEATTIRLIYKLFLEGHTPSSIAKQLMALKILSPTKRQKWPVSTVISILKNEKYKGDAILQKRYTTDFLTKK